MLLKQEGLIHRGPDFCHALKFVIKLQISTLLQQLAESGEESIVLTANVLEGTADHLGSVRGTGFLDDREQLQKQFLSYCTETRRFSVDDDVEHLPRSSTNSEHLLSPTLPTCTSVASPTVYHHEGPHRPRYDRESSTSDSVFSPNRRKSSASSKSLDEDVAMITCHDYSEVQKQYLETTAGSWGEDSSGRLSVEFREKGGVKCAISGRIQGGGGSAEIFEKGKSLTVKSPVCESAENIKHISLSSPTDFHYKPLTIPQQQPGTNNPPASSPGGRSSSEFRLSPTPKSLQQYTSGSGTGILSGEGAAVGVTYGGVSSKSTLATTLTAPPSTSPGSESSGSLNPGVNYGLVLNPGVVTSNESGFNPFFMYKVPFTSYGAGDPAFKSNISGFPPPLHDGDNNNSYKLKYESEELEKYKSQFAIPETEPIRPESSISVDSRGGDYGGRGDYGECIGGEHYRGHKKAEVKNYHRHGSSGRKQPKSLIERRASDTFVSPSTTSPSYLLQGKDKDSGTLDSGLAKTPEMALQPDLSKTFEEAVKVQQNIFHSSLGLLSPLHRQFIPPGRINPTRERSQSLSDFHTITSPEQVHSGRSRFPSSSFVENLDTPLVIDDEGKDHIIVSDEGLDLSNKKRKMSVDDVYPSTAEDNNPQEGAGVNISGQAGEEQEYERMSLNQASPAIRDDQSTKKYGKGNFIKVATGYQCRICCRVIRHMNNTTAHMRIHANIKPYKCQVCNQQFKYEVDRRYHFSKCHVDLFSKMYFPEEKKTG